MGLSKFARFFFTVFIGETSFVTSCWFSCMLSPFWKATCSKRKHFLLKEQILPFKNLHLMRREVKRFWQSCLRFKFCISFYMYRVICYFKCWVHLAYEKVAFLQSHTDLKWHNSAKNSWQSNLFISGALKLKWSVLVARIIVLKSSIHLPWQKTIRSKLGYEYFTT